MPDIICVIDLPRIKQESIKTMRKLPLLGYTNNKSLVIDYEWPKEQDMMSMIDDKPIEAVGFNWHKSDSHNGVYIGALQIILSNG